MTPRVDIVAIALSSTLADVVRICVESEHSRLPIYRDGLDDPVGVVHIKDLLKLLSPEPGRAAPIDHGGMYEADERLPRAIVAACAGPRLIALHDSVKPQAERYIRMYISMLTSDLRASVAEHDAMIDAIEAGTADAAQSAVQLNWRHAADRISKVIEVAGERGSW